MLIIVCYKADIFISNLWNAKHLMPVGNNYVTQFDYIDFHILINLSLLIPDISKYVLNAFWPIAPRR